MACRYLAFLAAIILVSSVSHGFKEEDFKKCQDASFCSRLRGASSTAWRLDAATVAVTGPRVTATVVNTRDPEASFSLTLTSYGGRMFRLHVDEPSADPPRYQVTDVLLPDVDASLATPWKVVKKSGNKLKLRLDDADADVEVTFAPIAVVATVAGRPALTWNAAGRFAIERRRREKHDDDPEGWWSENFKSHHDSKPRGPEALSFDVSFDGFSHVYGLPERAIAHSLPSTRHPNGTSLTEPYRLYNLDVFEYLADSPFGLYGSIPLLWAHRAGLTAGVFWLNAAEMYVDVEKRPASVSTQWIAESGIVDVVVMLASTPAQGAKLYASLTGGTAMPQMFALGYHQCRWNYKDQDDVAQVDAGFDAHDIPYDVLWLDIEHTDGKRYFTWDTSYFPTPTEMQDDLAERGRRMVTIVDPHIKRDADYRVFSEAEARGYFVKKADGTDFDGWCWPGSSSYPDWLRPEVRSWWADQFALDAYLGSTPSLYTWNDMNEPSVFNGPEITMHKDLVHLQGTDNENGVEHRDVHNVYGLHYHAASAEGLRRRGAALDPAGDRPFVLSRAFFAGTQRVGPIWTGDNGADWDHLRVSVPMLLSLGVAGLPFSGADVGGFFGNPDAELMTRWYQVGAFYPFFRGHAHLESKRREPWLFGDEATARIRDAIRTRYRLMPYIYTLFLHANATGEPIMRPMWYEFPSVAAVAAEDACFMLGRALAVAPVLSMGENTVRVVLPVDASSKTWYDAESGAAVAATSSGGSRWRSRSSSAPQTIEFEAQAPIDVIKSYIRGGSVLPIKERARRSTAAAAADPITLVIALDDQGTASGDLYLDDGRSYAAFQSGQYAYRNFTMTADGVLRSQSGATPAGLPPADSRYSTGLIIDKIVVLGLTDGPQGWEVAAVGGERLEAAPGPLTLKRGLPDVALVVRRPQLPAEGDWAIQFTRARGNAAAATA